MISADCSSLNPNYMRLDSPGRVFSRARPWLSALDTRAGAGRPSRRARWRSREGRDRPGPEIVDADRAEDPRDRSAARPANTKHRLGRRVPLAPVISDSFSRACRIRLRVAARAMIPRCRECRPARARRRTRAMRTRRVRAPRAAPRRTRTAETRASRLRAACRFRQRRQSPAPPRRPTIAVRTPSKTPVSGSTASHRPDAPVARTRRTLAARAATRNVPRDGGIRRT